VSAVNDRHLTLKALGMALKRRCPNAGLLHHSDEGCTYASEDYQRELDAFGITCSMSRKGNCYDNAVMEAFFSSVKTELADRFDSCGEAKMELFDYIEVFYNQRRRHSTLGQMSPGEFELHTRHLFHWKRTRPGRTISSAKPSTESDLAQPSPAGAQRGLRRGHAVALCAEADVEDEHGLPEDDHSESEGHEAVPR